ncbi:MAG: catalase [Pseudomonadota bacterium]
MTKLALGEELIGENEEHLIDRITLQNMFTMTLDKETGKQIRAQHTKGHGCAKARFTVRDDIPEELRKGVFAEPKTFNAIIRFSNGAHKDDRKPDAHGMAIKLPGVREDGGDQDFVMADHPVYFAEGMRDYLAFNTFFHEIIFFKKDERERLKLSIDPRVAVTAYNWLVLWLRSKFVFVRGIVMIVIKEPKLLPRLKKFAGQTPSSPLKTHYWSTLPYRLGEKAVKYMAQSPLVGDADAQSGVRAFDGLHQALAKGLQDAPAKFTFGVHLQTDAEAHPVEDGTANWAEAGAPFYPLAELEIPQQTLCRTIADQAAFTPWNAEEAHRPLGAINRIRRSVYGELSEARLIDQGLLEEEFARLAESDPQDGADVATG